MNSIGVLCSVLLGLGSATVGMIARPRVTTAENKTRTILTAVAAAVPVGGWILWLGHPLATGLPFIIGTVVVGQLRDRTRRPRPTSLATPATIHFRPTHEEGRTDTASPTESNQQSLVEIS